MRILLSLGLWLGLLWTVGTPATRSLYDAQHPKTVHALDGSTGDPGGPRP